MFSEADGRRIFLAAAQGFGYSTDPDVDVVWGVGRRTVAGAVINGDGSTAWLRLLAAHRPGGKLWTGNSDAEETLPHAVPRPRLLAVNDTADRALAVRAELMTYLRAGPVSPTPDLCDPCRPPKLDKGWWTSLREALAAVNRTSIPSWREPVVSEAFVARTIRRYLGVDVDPTSVPWVLSHGDLHWANLTPAPLHLLDWEGFGAVPAGFDAANLHAYSLTEPATAARIREVFSAELESPAGRLSQLLVAAIVLQTAERDPLHASIAAVVEEHARTLLPVG